ncbi:hypothetical protein [Turicimonas muris]|uniref:hypothetical protein n=3 Tax=Turicimonas muris TaxID=1796652 RepID=UPI0025A5A332|nr:hypothetical protein [Turicimonas muris]
MPLNFFSLIKAGAVIAALIFAYFLGLSNGKNSVELKNARAEISTLSRTIQEFKTKQTSDAIALAQLRVAESASRNELDWMRSQLSQLERRAKTDADRQRNRCLRLAIEGKELLEEASRAIKFCEENHR